GLGLSAAGVVRGRGAVRGARAAAEEGSWPGGPCSRVPAPAAANAAMRTAPTHPEGSGSWKTIMPARIGSAFVSSVESPAVVEAPARLHAASRTAVPAAEEAAGARGEGDFGGSAGARLLRRPAARGEEDPRRDPPGRGDADGAAEERDAESRGARRGPEPDGDPDVARAAPFAVARDERDAEQRKADDGDGGSDLLEPRQRHTRDPGDHDREDPNAARGGSLDEREGGECDRDEA